MGRLAVHRPKGAFEICVTITVNTIIIAITTRVSLPAAVPAGVSGAGGAAI